ncbi:hypothetical protein V1478_010939 [Vespula squamosa]|uniref:Uncharacterized protein n=1 Tax=Vespula squamosa TaxID=30214 RepID=A0ABD2AFS1_VESSQ
MLYDDGSNIRPSFNGSSYRNISQKKGRDRNRTEVVSFSSMHFIVFMNLRDKIFLRSVTSTVGSIESTISIAAYHISRTQTTGSRNTDYGTRNPVATEINLRQNLDVT